MCWGRVEATVILLEGRVAFGLKWEGAEDGPGTPPEAAPFFSAF